MKMGFTKIACRLTEPTYALSASQTLEGVCQRTILMQNSGTTTRSAKYINFLPRHTERFFQENNSEQYEAGVDVYASSFEYYLSSLPRF